jgi:hypothetical protein
MTTPLLATAVWIPGLFVLGIVLIIAIIAVAMKTMRRGRRPNRFG